MSYFKPLRRKFGVITLLMACAFTAGWVRSMFFHDSAGFTEDGLTDVLISYHGRIYGMQMIPEDKKRNKPHQSKFVWNSVSFSDAKDSMLNLPELKWQFCGIGMREMSIPGLRIVVSEVSYWLIVLPLTLLSTWLLLSKPKHKTKVPV